MNRFAPHAFAAVVVVALTIGITLLAPAPSNVGPPSRPEPTAMAIAEPPREWVGPVRVVEGAPHLLPMVEARPRADSPSGPILLLGWDEESVDAPVPWVDITGVRFTPGELVTWYVDLGVYPPRTTRLDRDQTLVSYGLVLDANADGVADYELGMSNDAPIRGELRLWITNLASGEVDEHVGRPNGRPFEQWHPDERASEGIQRQLRFTVPESDLPGVASAFVRFYAWSSVTDGSDVVAWDYAPDTGWLTAHPAGTP